MPHMQIMTLEWQFADIQCAFKFCWQCCRQGGGGNRSTLPWAPSVRGAPNRAELFQIRSSSSFTSQSSFLRSLFRCIVDLKSACFFALYLMLLMQTLKMLTLSYVTTAQSLTRALYVVLFDLKPLNKDGNCTVCMLEKEPQKSPEHTSEHVKSQNFLGVCPQTPLT